MRAVRRLIAVLMLALAGGVCASPAAEQLLAAESLPATQKARRIALLESARVEPGSALALERLYQLSLIKDHPPPTDADWAAWQQQAGRERASHAPWVRQLVSLRDLLLASRYGLAREQADAMGPVPTGLPDVWRLRALLSRATALEETGEAQNALLLRLEAAPLVESLGPDWRRASALGALAFTYSRLGQHERALATARESLERARLSRDVAALVDAHSTLSAVHGLMGQLEESREEGERALEQARQSKDEEALAFQLANLADSYLRLRQPDRALALADEAHALSLTLRRDDITSLSLHNRGMALIQLGRLAEGTESVRRSVTLELQGGGITYAAEGLLELGAGLESGGDLAGAYQAFRDHHGLMERQSDQQRSQALAEAQQRFDMAQRGREAERLRSENAAQAEALRAERLRFGLGALVLACAAALLWLTVLLVRRMRRVNRELAQTNEELAAATERDPLTGLGNRRRLPRLLEALPPPSAEHPLGVVLLDIDHFKLLNDRHGHAAGDAALVAVAARLRAAVRGDDHAIRWGGEEFLLLLPGADAERTAALTQRLLDTLGEEPVSLRDGRSVAVRASVGALSLPAGALSLDVEAAIDLADQLMYRAKSHGRNQAWCLLGTSLPDVPAVLRALGEASHPELLMQRLRGRELP